MRPSFAVAALFFSLIASPHANASPLYYTITDLGTASPNGTDVHGVPVSATLMQGANGGITGVTNAAGTMTYAFDKSPVEVSQSNGFEGFLPDLHYGRSWVTTFQTQGGTFSVSSTWDIASVEGGGIQTGPFWGGLSDVNIHAEMVGGTSGGATLGVAGIPGVGELGFEGVAYGSYVNPTSDPSFYLMGLNPLVDDLGRIIAEGTDGHEYLLTPTSLGAPQTVPEPSTLIIFGLGVAALLASRVSALRLRPILDA